MTDGFIITIKDSTNLANNQKNAFSFSMKKYIAHVSLSKTRLTRQKAGHAPSSLLGSRR